MPRKVRVEIPIDISAKVLFDSDRTCCICREKKAVQIHHIDEDPANNDPKNLAVLCFDCHHDTQIRGGFGRKLDAEQVRLYRDDWLNQVRRRRMIVAPAESVGSRDISTDVRQVAAQLEIYKAAEDWFHVAWTYDRIGDAELRDKYIEMALQQNPRPFDAYRLARMQGKTTNLPPDFIDAVIQDVGGDWTWVGAILRETGDVVAATQVYLKGIKEALENGSWFLAAFYIRHGLNETIADNLFAKSLRESAWRW